MNMNHQQHFQTLFQAAHAQQQLQQQQLQSSAAVTAGNQGEDEAALSSSLSSNLNYDEEWNNDGATGNTPAGTFQLPSGNGALMSPLDSASRPQGLDRQALFDNLFRSLQASENLNGANNVSAFDAAMPPSAFGHANGTNNNLSSHMNHPQMNAFNPFMHSSNAQQQQQQQHAMFSHQSPQFNAAAAAALNQHHLQREPFAPPTTLNPSASSTFPNLGHNSFAPPFDLANLIRLQQQQQQREAAFPTAQSVFMGGNIQGSLLAAGIPLDVEKPDPLPATELMLPQDKPVKALSPYNFFFREERDRILNGTKEEDYSEAKKDSMLAEHWFRDRTKKRRHRKTHGKIDFTTLSRMVSQRWKELPSDRKDFFKQVATKDLERYRRELNQQQTQQHQRARESAVVIARSA